MVRLTDRLDMTIAVDWDVTTKYTLVVLKVAWDLDRCACRSIELPNFFDKKTEIDLLVDNQKKYFGPRSGPTECLSLAGSKLFDTLILFLNIFFF